MKYIKNLIEFLDEELQNYGMNYELDHIDDEIYEAVIVFENGNTVGNGSLMLQLSEKDGNIIIEVETSEDCWEEVDGYSNSIKHFWIALLL